MTDDNARRLDEIRRRVEAASPGPWEFDTKDVYFDGEYGHIAECATLGGCGFQHVNNNLENYYNDWMFISSARQDIPWLLDKLSKAEEELDDANSLFDLQHKRTVIANKLWQKIQNKPDTMPDLGELIKWLLDRAEKAESLLADKEKELAKQGERLVEAKEVIELVRENIGTDQDGGWHFQPECDGGPQELAKAVEQYDALTKGGESK